MSAEKTGDIDWLSGIEIERRIVQSEDVGGCCMLDDELHGLVVCEFSGPIEFTRPNDSFAAQFALPGMTQADRVVWRREIRVVSLGFFIHVILLITREMSHTNLLGHKVTRDRRLANLA